MFLLAIALQSAVQRRAPCPDYDPGEHFLSGSLRRYASLFQNHYQRHMGIARPTVCSELPGNFISRSSKFGSSEVAKGDWTRIGAGCRGLAPVLFDARGRMKSLLPLRRRQFHQNDYLTSGACIRSRAKRRDPSVRGSRTRGGPSSECHAREYLRSPPACGVVCL